MSNIWDGDQNAKQLSYSKDGIVHTTYLDNSIVKGQVYFLCLAINMTASTPIYFTADLSLIENAVFLLPLSINPTAGYVTVSPYRDTGYTGGL